MANQVISADGTVLTVDGIVVGGIESFTIFDGVTRDIEHAPLSGSGRQYFPAVPDYGTIGVTLYRNPADPGQLRMEQARTARQRMDGVITLIDGTTRSFLCYVKVLPIMGGDRNGVGTVQASLKVAGPTT